MEIVLTLIYSLFIGFYNVFRKLSLKRSNESTTLVMFTTVTFLWCLIWIPFGIITSWKYILLFAVKGFLLALSWFLILKVLRDADLSVVAVTRNVLAAIFAFVSGITLFNESVGVLRILGAVIIIVGVTLINIVDKSSKKSVKAMYFVLLLISALITALSSVIDKYTTAYCSLQQTQFWSMLFVAIFSWIFFLFECLKKKEFLIKKNDLKNFWIYLVGTFLFIGDVMLFLAYRVPGSQLITISILTKLQVVVSVLASVVIFKEKNALKKILLTLMVILGVVLMTLF